jgi:signal peptidase II
MTPKLKLFLGALLVSLPIDLATKEWVIRSIHYGGEIPVIPGFFSLTHVRNPGAAFGLLASSPQGVRIFFFIGVAIFAMGLIISFYRNLAPGDRLASLSLGMILGGAMGNLLDRLRHGEVVDFLHFTLWSGYTWPDFNFADSFVVVGVILLVIELLASEGESREDARAGSET